MGRGAPVPVRQQDAQRKRDSRGSCNGRARAWVLQDMTSGYRQSPPKLSLCIATLNRAPYLNETLECLVPQLNSDVEIVILDGGSRDRTPDVVERFRRRFPQLKYERKAEAGGIDRDFDKAVALA